jgi:eukaryotic-like serine/threonine-protein kinase
VADFGIAAATGDATGDGVSGTPEFMSPEQALGKSTDARSDLYGLGVTAFFAFSGRLPFEGSTSTEVLAKHVTEPAPPLDSLGLAVPRKLAVLIDRCLAKEPDHRPASAEALAEQLGLSLEQRRELPAALRAFVKRTGRIDGTGAMAAALALSVGSTAISALAGVGWGFGALVAGVAGLPFAYLVRVARRLLRLGFAHADLRPAFKGEIEQAREELAVEATGGASRLEHALRIGAKVGAAVAGITGVTAIVQWVSTGAVSRSVPGLWPPAGLFIMAGTVAIGSTIGYIALLQRRRDVDTEFWSRLWMGGIGRLAFSLARRTLRGREIGTAMTHRATELSLGMAAEQLYESLPRESRQALGDLPGVLRRLQADAQALRKRYDEVQEALGDAGDGADADQYADLRTSRDEVHTRLGMAVGALETIRLNLLRLHAGSLSIEGLTTHLGDAAEVSAQVERLLEAHEEVERSLGLPGARLPTPTPTPT